MYLTHRYNKRRAANPPSFHERVTLLRKGRRTNQEIKAMTKEQQEKQITLALFMGARLVTNNHYEFPVGVMFPAFGMKYDQSWDWLMSIVDKLEDLNRVKGRLYNGTFSYNAPSKNSDTWIVTYAMYVKESSAQIDIFGTGTTKIAATFDACVKAVENLKGHES